MNDDLPIFGDDLLSVSISRGPDYAVVSVAGEIARDVRQRDRKLH
jgi:hypothetical protein